MRLAPQWHALCLVEGDEMTLFTDVRSKLKFVLVGAAAVLITSGCATPNAIARSTSMATAALTTTPPVVPGATPAGPSLAPSFPPTAATTATPLADGTATPAPPTARPVEDTLDGGRYVFKAGPDAARLTIEATGPAGWVGYPDWAMDGPEPLRADAPNGIGMSFFTANGLFSNPCHWNKAGTGSSQTGDVKVGPTVDDLVGALGATSSIGRQPRNQ